MMDDLGESASLDLIDARAARWLHIAAWVIALVVFELTANPALVVFVGCLKFGWTQFRAARWLRRNDPDRARGRACRWFYMSWGMWRISGVAFLLIMVAASLLNWFRQLMGAAPKPPDALPTQLIAGIAVALLGFAFAMITSTFGFVTAWRNRVKVWVGDEAIAAFRRREWPPNGPARSWNRIVPMCLVGMTVAVSLGSTLVIGIGSGVVALARSLIGEQAAVTAWKLGASVGFIGALILIAWLVDGSKLRIHAASPADCWPHQEGTPPSSSQITLGSALR
jgi:hypothetical protein